MSERPLVAPEVSPVAPDSLALPTPVSLSAPGSVTAQPFVIDEAVPAPVASSASAPAPAASNDHAAPWSAVDFGPPADWVSHEEYDATVRGREGDHLTYLLCARQELAGTGLSFHSLSTRLETALAVQEESQWSVRLDPRRQSLTVHWLRVVRDGKVIDHLHRHRLRLIQRETRLEHLVIDGSWTLMSVLEDVRPGDVLESAYTVHDTKPIRPASTEVFFVVPPQIVVGRYRITVHAEPGAPELKWKTSSDAPAMSEIAYADGRRRLVWKGEQLTLREMELNQPTSNLDYIWIQVSDLVDWRDLATHVAAAWALHADADGIDAIPEFARPAEVDEAAIVQLVQNIQDHFRYLSVNIELGGWTPTAPGIVARRRYGDCKDLAWLATGVLRSWGVVARPVLVASALLEQVSVLLPSAHLFNHAVLEVEFNGHSRWFDLTGRAQGGNFHTQAITWFGHGLPIDANSEGLRAQPGVRAPSVYSIDETILLDTRPKQSSMVEFRVRVEGIYADLLRHERNTAGTEQFVKDRLQHAANRYVKALRIGTLHWRDDRVANVCELVEVFEIREFLYIDEKSQLASFSVPFNLVVQSFAIPLERPRRTDWALPFPLDVRHKISIRGPGMHPAHSRKRKWAEHGFSGVIDEPKMAGLWSKVVQFSVTQSRITPARIAEYRKELERFMVETNWHLIVPANYSRVRRNKGFGEFVGDHMKPLTLTVPRRIEPVVKPTDETRPAEPTSLSREIIPNAKLGDLEQIYPRVSGRRRSSRNHSSQVEIPAWLWRAAGTVLAIVIIALVRVCARAAL